jgi:hypothetical protein
MLTIKPPPQHLQNMEALHCAIHLTEVATLHCYNCDQFACLACMEPSCAHDSHRTVSLNSDRVDLENNYKRMLANSAIIKNVRSERLRFEENLKIGLAQSHLNIDAHIDKIIANIEKVRLVEHLGAEQYAQEMRSQLRVDLAKEEKLVREASKFAREIRKLLSRQSLPEPLQRMKQDEEACSELANEMQEVNWMRFDFSVYQLFQAQLDQISKSACIWVSDHVIYSTRERA